MWITGLLSALCFSFMSVTVAHFGKDFSASEFLLGRSLVGMILLAPFLFKRNASLTLSPLLIIRGIVGTAAIMIFLYMIQKIGAGTAATLHYTSPIFVTLLGIFFMREKLTIQRLVALTLVILGVCLPSFHNIDSISFHLILLGCCGAFLSGISFFLLKLMTPQISEIAIYWFFCLIQFLLQVPLSFYSDSSALQIRYTHLLHTNVIPCLAVGGFACLAQVLMNNSFKHLNATTASLLNLLSIPFTVLIERLAFNKGYSSLQYLMIALIFAGVLILRLKLPTRSLFNQRPGHRS